MVGVIVTSSTCTFKFFVTAIPAAASRQAMAGGGIEGVLLTQPSINLWQEGVDKSSQTVHTLHNLNGADHCPLSTHYTASMGLITVHRTQGGSPIFHNSYKTEDLEMQCRVAVNGLALKSNPKGKLYTSSLPNFQPSHTPHNCFNPLPLLQLLGDLGDLSQRIYQGQKSSV